MEGGKQVKKRWRGKREMGEEKSGACVEENVMDGTGGHDQKRKIKKGKIEKGNEKERVT